MFGGCVGGCRCAIFCSRVDNPPCWPEHLFHINPTSIPNSLSRYLLGRPLACLTCLLFTFSTATRYTLHLPLVVVYRPTHGISYQPLLTFRSSSQCSLTRTPTTPRGLSSPQGGHHSLGVRLTVSPSINMLSPLEHKHQTTVFRVPPQ
jgi:hypothetical protein